MPKNQRIYKMRSISSFLQKDFDDVVREMYLNQQMPAMQISEELFKITKIRISTRSIQRQLKTMGIVRTFSEAFNLAIKTGRKTYDALRRPIKSKELRKGINRLRYKIMLRDDFKCVLCGATAEDDRLIIDHKVPVVFGGTNDENNLRTLCRTCNHGKMLLEERKKITN